MAQVTKASDVSLSGKQEIVYEYKGLVKILWVSLC